MVYRQKMSDVDWLKCILINLWTRLGQDKLNRAIDQLPKRLMMVIRVLGAHVDLSGLILCADDRCSFNVCSS